MYKTHSLHLQYKKQLNTGEITNAIIKQHPPRLEKNKKIQK